MHDSYAQNAHHFPSPGQTPAPQPNYSELLAENDRLRSLVLQVSSENTARPISSLALMDQQEQELYLCLRTHYRPAGISSISEVIFPSDKCCQFLFSQAAEWAWLHSAVSPATFEQHKAHFESQGPRKDPPNASEASWLALYFSYLTVRYSRLILLWISFTDTRLIDWNYVYKPNCSA